MKILNIANLYAGIGGNAKEWDGSKCKITAVELDPKIAEVYKKLYPEDTVIVGDAHEYLRKHFREFDFIWASPPCQSHTRLQLCNQHKSSLKYPDMSLYQEILWLQTFFRGKWVIENVKPYYKPLIQPTFVIGRHYFWSSDFIMIPGLLKTKSPKGFTDNNSLKKIKELEEWLGIYLEKPIYYGNNHSPCQVLRNCVHPEIGKYIFEKITGGKS